MPKTTGRSPSVRGFTIIELLVAMLILSMVLTVLASSLVASQRASAANGRLMRAVLLAADGLEQARGGTSLTSNEEGFRRTVDVGPPDAQGLRRADATVRWHDRTDQAVRLSTVIFTPPEQ